MLTETNRMKKLLIAFFFIIFSATVSAQLTFPSAGGSPTTVPTYQGGVKGKLYFMLPIVDTTNNRATPYPGALTILPNDTLNKEVIPPIYISNGRFWGRASGGSGGTGVDSVTFPETPTRQVCIWSGGFSQCYAIGGYYDSTGYNHDSTYFYHYSNGAFVDSVWVPYTHVYEGQGVGFRDTTYLGVRAQIFNAEVHYVTPDSLYLVTLNPDGSIKDSIQWVGLGVSTSTTTADSTIVATDGQEDFPYPNVPASAEYFIIFRNGVAIEPIYFTIVGSSIRFIEGMEAGDMIRYKRIK